MSNPSLLNYISSHSKILTRLSQALEKESASQQHVQPTIILESSDEAINNVISNQLFVTPCLIPILNCSQSLSKAMRRPSEPRQSGRLLCPATSVSRQQCSLSLPKKQTPHCSIESGAIPLPVETPCNPVTWVKRSHLEFTDSNSTTFFRLFLPHATSCVLTTDFSCVVSLLPISSILRI